MDLFKEQKEGSYRVMKARIRTLDFFSKCNGKPSEGFKQRRDMTWTQGLHKFRCQDLVAV